MSRIPPAIIGMKPSVLSAFGGSEWIRSSSHTPGGKSPFGAGPSAAYTGTFPNPESPVVSVSRMLSTDPE